VNKLTPKEFQVSFIKVNYVAEAIYKSLLRALKAITERDTIFSLNEHSCTIFLVIFISEAAGMNPEHIRVRPNNFWENSHPLVLAMMQRILRAIHKN